MTVFALRLTIILSGLGIVVIYYSIRRLTHQQQENMFTAEQLKTAHSKVRSGEDFPAYIQEIKALGVTHYETYVVDGHTIYHGANGHTVHVAAKYEPMAISDGVKEDAFKAGLKAHQRGETDFLAFIGMCADCGVEKWQICMDAMTCTYYDKAGKEVLVEEIPH